MHLQDAGYEIRGVDYCGFVLAPIFQINLLSICFSQNNLFTGSVKCEKEELGMEEQYAGPEPQTVNKPVKGTFWRLQGIFFEPAKTFEDINLKPTVLVPIIICIVIGMIAVIGIGTFADYEELAIKAIEERPQAERLTDEQIQQSARIPAIIMQVAGPIVVPIYLLALSGILMLLAVLSGGETNYKKILSMVANVNVFHSLIKTVLTLLVFGIAADPMAIDLQNPVSTNLGFLFSQKESPGLYTLASWIDIIAFYVIYLMGLGLCKVSTGIKLGKGVLLVAIPYIVLTLIFSGIAAAFS